MVIAIWIWNILALVCQILDVRLIQRTATDTTERKTSGKMSSHENWPRIGHPGDSTCTHIVKAMIMLECMQNCVSQNLCLRSQIMGAQTSCGAHCDWIFGFRLHHRCPRFDCRGWRTLLSLPIASEETVRFINGCELLRHACQQQGRKARWSHVVSPSRGGKQICQCGKLERGQLIMHWF